MRFRLYSFPILALLLVLVAALTACGFGGNEPTATATRRATRATRAPAATNVANPTSDTLDDSNPTADPNQPTPDALDDSNNQQNNSGEPTSASAGAGDQAEQVIALKLPGSAWLDEQADQIYRFCSDGRWEIVQGGDTVQGNGTFTAEGESLVLKNASDNQATTYQMTWHNTTEILELDNGSANLILHFDGKSDCP